MFRSLFVIAAALLALAAAPFAAAPAQPLEPPVPPGAADGINQRMAQRRAQQLGATQPSPPATTSVQGRTVSPAPVAPSAATPATAPAIQLDPARWPALLERLGSPDFAQRDAAQQELDQTTWRDLDLLQKSAAAAADPEIKARLESRLAALHEQIAADPPPISINLKNASLAEVAAALSRTLGFPLDALPSPANETFTLTATDQPFWKVFFDLSAQHGLAFEGTGYGLRLTTRGSPWYRATLVGPLAVVPQTITRQRTAAPQGAPGSVRGAESTALYVAVALDPRIRVVGYAPIAFTELTDDLGNPLHRGTAPDQVSNFDGAAGFLQFPVVAFQSPPKIGTRIATAKGRVRVLVQTAEDHLDIPDPEARSGQSVTFAGTTVKLDRFAVQNNGGTPVINFNLSVQAVPPALPNLNGEIDIVTFETRTPTVSFIDADGKIAYSALLRGGTGGTVAGSYTPPFKIRLSSPTKTKVLNFPFELKDLPIP